MSDRCASISCSLGIESGKPGNGGSAELSPSPVLAAAREAERVTAATGCTQGVSHPSKRDPRLDLSTLGGTLAHTLDLASPLPRIMAVPCNGSAGRTPTATSPWTKSESIYTLCRGTDKTFRLIPRTKTDWPVSEAGENGNTDCKINDSTEPVSLSILIGTFSPSAPSETEPSEIKGEKLTSNSGSFTLIG